MTASPGARDILGIAVHPLTMDQTVDRCRDAIKSGRRLTIGMVNAAKVIKMRQDPILHAAVAGSDLILADGMAIVWASRVLGQSLPERVAGIDLFMRLLDLADKECRSVYLVGATDEVLQQTVDEIKKRFPRVIIAGARNGYFDDAAAPALADQIRASGADMLFVGVSSPKKEIFLSRFGHATGARVCHGVGGSFDVLAGKVKRAPLIWQKLGCEWLYRALQEPRRLMGRYVATNGRFVGLLTLGVFARLFTSGARAADETLRS